MPRISTKPATRKTWVNYFQHRPQGDSLSAKAARAQIETLHRPITLPAVAWLSRHRRT